MTCGLAYFSMSNACIFLIVMIWGLLTQLSPHNPRVSLRQPAPTMLLTTTIITEVVGVTTIEIVDIVVVEEPQQ